MKLRIKKYRPNAPGRASDGLAALNRRKKDTKWRELGPEHIKAALVYARTGSFTAAAEIAGVNSRTVGSWYKKQKLFRRAVQNEAKYQAGRYEVTEENVIAELAKIGFTNLEDVVEWDEDGMKVKNRRWMNKHARAAISELSFDESAKKGRKIKVKLHGKKDALDSLGRTMGIFKDKLETDSKGELIIRTVSYARNIPDKNGTSSKTGSKKDNPSKKD